LARPGLAGGLKKFKKVGLSPMGIFHLRDSLSLNGHEERQVIGFWATKYWGRRGLFP